MTWSGCPVISRWSPHCADTSWAMIAGVAVVSVLFLVVAVAVHTREEPENNPIPGGKWAISRRIQQFRSGQ